jgi:hypothetical protein
LSTWQEKSDVEPHPEGEEDRSHEDQPTKKTRRLVVAVVFDSL